MLLIRFLVHSVLVKNIRSPRFDLRLNNLIPYASGFYSLPSSSSIFVFCVEFFEFFTMTIRQSGTFIGAHQSPVLILHHSLHKEIWNPHPIEEVSCSVFFLAKVLFELQEIDDISVPWFEVNSD